MTNDQLKNIGWYVLYAVAGAVVATGGQLGVILSGTGEILWRPLAATFTVALFGSLTTAIGAATLARVGGEQTAAEVDDWRERGYRRSELMVVPKSESVPSSDVPAPPNFRTYNVLHGTGGHVAFLSTAEPSPGAEMPADSALHVYNRRPYASDGQPFRCDSCAEELHHVEAIDGEWIAI